MIVLAAAVAGFGARTFVQAPPPAEKAPLNEVSGRRQLLAALGGLAGAAVLEGLAPPAEAGLERQRIAYPPINRQDKKRCIWKSSAMGQANAARDKLFDLRECKMSGTDASDKDIAGVLMNEGEFKDVKFVNTIMSKAVAYNATFDGSTFQNAVVDRVTFDGSSLKNSIFVNTVLTGTTFDGCDLENADFSQAIYNQGNIRALCKNPTLKGTNPVTGADTYLSAGCDMQSMGR